MNNDIGNKTFELFGSMYFSISFSSAFSGIKGLSKFSKSVSFDYHSGYKFIGKFSGEYIFSPWDGYSTSLGS